MTDRILYAGLDAVQEAVFVLDEQRRVLFANKVSSELFGKGFVGYDFVQVIRHPDCLKIIGDVLGGQEIAKKSIAIEFPIKTLFSVLVSNLSSASDGTLKILVSLKDISDMQEAEHIRSDFVANVSHELRSPLTALSGFIETLQGPAKDDDVARERFLNLMDQESSRMTRLIHDLLSLSKIEANLRIRPSGVADIAAVIRRVETILREQAGKEQKQIEINVACPSTRINGNEDDLTQVFQNLLENAIKYGGFKTKIRIDISAAERVTGILGPSVKIAVSDKGEGIPREHIARLTERFYRVDTHRSRDKGGTGLGLAIVKHIINRYRGRLQIESEVGVGSVFTVYLPISY